MIRTQKYVGCAMEHSSYAATTLMFNKVKNACLVLQWNLFSYRFL